MIKYNINLFCIRFCIPFCIFGFGLRNINQNQKIAATSGRGGEKPGENTPDDILNQGFEEAYKELSEPNRREFEQEKFGIHYNSEIEKYRNTDKNGYRAALCKRHLVIRFLYGPKSFAEGTCEVAKALSEALDREAYRFHLESAWDADERIEFAEAFPEFEELLAQARESNPILYIEILEFRRDFIFRYRQSYPQKSMKDFFEDFLREFLSSPENKDFLKKLFQRFLDSQEESESEEDEDSGDSDGDSGGDSDEDPGGNGD